MSHQLAKEDEQKLNKGTDPARNKLHAGRGGEHPVPQAGRKRRLNFHVYDGAANKNGVEQTCPKHSFFP